MHQQLQPAFTKLKTNLHSILSELEQLDENALNFKPAASKWSCAQIMLHVNLANAATLSYLNKKMQQPELIQKSGIGAQFRSALLNVALQSDIKFKAPKGLDHLPDYASFTEIQTATKQNISKLEQLLTNFPEQLMLKNVFKHPAAGRINMHQTINFLNAHALHHKRQITEIIKKLHN